VQIAQALQHAGHRAVVVAAPGRLVGELEACGAEFIPLAIGAKHPLVLRHLWALRDVMREVDIVHARSRLPAWLGRAAWRLLPPHARPAWVTTVHGPYTVNAYSRIMVSGERVIAISNFIRDYVQTHYPEVSPARLTVIPRGVDRAAYSYDYEPDTSWRSAWQQARPELRGRQLVVLPARLTRWKGQLDFIAVMADLRRHGHNVHGLIVGDAHPRKHAYSRELHAAAEAAGVADAVSFLGHRHDLREILAHAALACSFTRAPEAFGRTTIEALSLGTPVVGYDHGGTGEILRAIFPAGLVPRGDVKAAAARIASLLAAPQTVPREHPYTVERMQSATLAVYDALAG
jgi:glycosyltransferase involved in cell wall biosynthesis